MRDIVRVLFCVKEREESWSKGALHSACERGGDSECDFHSACDNGRLVSQ